MSQSMNELERDIEQTRSRLDDTIDRIQDRLSVAGIVDEVMGATRVGQVNSLVDNALAVVRRNPVPVMLVAAGVGWLIHRMTSSSADGRFDPYRERGDDIPVLNTGAARVYDPDVSPRHPGQDSLESRRDLSARA